MQDTILGEASGKRGGPLNKVYVFSFSMYVQPYAKKMDSNQESYILKNEKKDAESILFGGL